MENLKKIQEELKAPKNQYNNFGKYKYRNLEDILEAVKPLLVKYDCLLVLTDSIKEIAGVLFVESKASFTDSDGNSKEVTAQAGIEPDRKGMDIAQSFGASSSYARKYALNGLFLIDDAKDPDSQEGNEKKSDSVQKPWLSEINFEAAKAKIIQGEEDVIKNLDKHYKIKKAYRSELEHLEAEVASKGFQEQFDIP